MRETLSTDRFEADALFRSAFEFAAIGMALVAPNGRFLRVNRSLCEITDYPQKELSERTFQDITHPDDLNLDLDYAGRLLRGEIETYQMEKRYFHKNGPIVWIHLSASLVRADDSTPLFFISQIKNITDRKEDRGRVAQSRGRDRKTSQWSAQNMRLDEADRGQRSLGSGRRVPARFSPA